MIIAGGRLMTARAHRPCAAARSHVDLDGAALRAQPRLLVDEARKVMAVVEEGDQPHAGQVQNTSQVDGRALGARPAAADDELAAYCPDLDQWPTSWMYEERDLSPGRQIVKCFKPFLHHLLSRGLSRKSLRQHRDNLWLILSLPQRPQQLIGSRPVDMWTTLKKRCPHCPQPQQMQCQPVTHIDQGTAPRRT